MSRLLGIISKNKILAQNFSYLTTLQFFNLAIPLITYPYLIRVLGKDIYGLVAFAQAIISYLLIFVNFGFNISATKEISFHRDNISKLSEIISSVLQIKFILFILSLIILISIVFIVPQAKDYKMLFLLSISACLYDIIFPVWYFQGIEQMKYITYITLLGRLTFLSLIFPLVQGPNDYLFVPIVYGFGYFICGLVALYIIFFKHKINFQLQPILILKKYFIDSIPIFVSNISMNLMTSTNKVICGTFLGMEEVAYYDLAEKITSILKMPQIILSQTLFPKIAKKMNIQFIKKLYILSISFHLFLMFTIIVFSHKIVTFLGGIQMEPAIGVVIILILTIPFVVTSNFLSILVLIPLKFDKIFSKVFVNSLIFYLIVIFIQYILWGFSITSISYITLLTEIFITTYLYYYCNKLNLLK